MTIDMHIDTNKLKAARINKGWTQQHLADVSSLGLRTIQRTESGGKASIETINALNAVFEVERSFWECELQDHGLVVRTGWKIALLTLALAHFLTVLGVWYLTGEVNQWLLNTLVVTWLILLLISSVSYWLKKFQKVDSYRDLVELSESIRQQRND